MSLSLTTRNGRPYLEISEDEERNVRRIELGDATWRNARWRVGFVDMDGNGEHEVLCVGERRDGRARRYVLYVPRTQRAFNIQTGSSAREAATFLPQSLNLDEARMRLLSEKGQRTHPPSN